MSELYVVQISSNHAGTERTRFFLKNLHDNINMTISDKVDPRAGFEGILKSFGNLPFRCHLMICADLLQIYKYMYRYSGIR